MSYYRPCPVCGAALDPGELCDCLDTGKDLPVLPHRNATRMQREKAAPVLPHRNGQKVERELPTPHSASEYKPN